MYRELLDTAIGTAPPSTVDLESIVARQRRLRVLRGSGAAGAAVATVAVLTVVALAVGHPGAGNPRLSVGGPPAASASAAPDPSGATGSPTPAPTAYPSLLGPEPTEPPSAAEERLQVAIRDAVHAVAPGATIRDLDGAPTFRFTRSDTTGTAAPPGSVPQFGYAGTASVTVNGRTGNLVVMVARAGAYRESCGGLPGAVCVPLTGRHGESGFAVSQQVDEGGQSRLQVHLWLDRSMVDACVVTIGMSVDESVSGPPLTVNQLTEIAENPAVTLYP